MNTTTNTRGVSEAMVEQIEAAFEQWENDASVVSLFAAFKAGVAYAAALRQNPERRVSSEEVRLSLDYSRNFARANPRLSKTTVEHIEGLCNLVERLAALSAPEPAAQGAIGYFSADPAEGWFNKHKTLADAVAVAESLLESAQDDASDYGWQDEPPQICYGVVLGGCVEKEGSRRPAPEGSEFTELVDYRLTAPPAQPAAPHFPDANALADWLESLHECHTDGAVGNRKWEVAQIAAKAVRGAAQPAAQGEADLAGYVDPEQVADMQRNGGGVSIGSFSERYGRTVPVYFRPAPPARPAERVPDGLKFAIAHIQQKADAYAEENCGVEWDTGATTYHHGQAGEDYHHGLLELVDELTQLASPAPSEGGKGVEG